MTILKVPTHRSILYYMSTKNQPYLEYELKFSKPIIPRPKSINLSKFNNANETSPVEHQIYNQPKRIGHQRFSYCEKMTVACFFLAWLIGLKPIHAGSIGGILEILKPAGLRGCSHDESDLQSVRFNCGWWLN